MGSGWPLGTIVKVVLVLLLFGAAAVALQGGWDKLGDYRWQFEPWAVAAGLVVMLVASVGGAVAWLAVSRAFGAQLALWPALRIYSTSNLGKYLPGKVLHAFARIYLAQQHGVPLPLATASVVTDVVLTVAAAMLMLVVALPSIVGNLTDLGGSQVTALALVGLVGCLAMLHPSALNAGFRVARRLMPRREFPTIEASYPTILRSLVFYIALWVTYAIGLYASVQAVHPISPAAFPSLAAIVSFSYLSGLIMPLAPGGLGVREGVMTFLLSQLMPVPAAAAASVLSRVLQVAAEALCAAAFSRT